MLVPPGPALRSSTATDTHLVVRLAHFHKSEKGGTVRPVWDAAVSRAERGGVV